MSANTLRNRVNGTITALDLADATAANRRFEVALGTKGAESGGTRFIGFAWVKTTSQAVTVTVSKIDTANSDKEYILEGPTSDGGELTGTWSPQEEEISGFDPEAPSTTGWKYRLQFSQAGGACSASPTATYKAV